MVGKHPPRSPATPTTPEDGRLSCVIMLRYSGNPSFVVVRRCSQYKKHVRSKKTTGS